MPINGEENFGLTSQQLSEEKVLVASILLLNQSSKYQPEILNQFLAMKMVWAAFFWLWSQDPETGIIPLSEDPNALRGGIN